MSFVKQIRTHRLALRMTQKQFASMDQHPDPDPA
jgi:hypothetical protein